MSAPVSVVVVDDQAPFRLAARTVLRRTDGFELTGESSSGEEAVEVVKELHPALVLMDINMPGMNGIEATRRIVADDPDVVIILCSTYEIGDLPTDAATSGARAYVQEGAPRTRRPSPALVRTIERLRDTVIGPVAGPPALRRPASDSLDSGQRHRAADDRPVTGL